MRRARRPDVTFTLGGGARLFDELRPLKLQLVSERAASVVIHVTYRLLR